ncbi:MAG: oligosaccharide flippase family protein [Bacteroidota bacterium]|nr:oligosaccharide flippase family protein [Bacteroidota bacterium]
MKKILVLFSVLFLFAIAYAQQDTSQCPFGGREDCTGYCGLFTDNNGDGYCDYSLLTNQKQENTKQEKTEKEYKTPPPIAEPKVIKATDNKETKQVSTQESNETENFLTESITEMQTSVSNTSQTKPIKSHSLSPYHFWLLLVLTLVLYFCSVALVKYKILKKATHRKIWNLILLLTCLVSCLLGIYIVLAKMYGWAMNYMTVLKLHVDFGIVMTIVAIIHIVWHLRYFKNMFKHSK